MFEKLIQPQLLNSFFGDLASFAFDADEEQASRRTSRALERAVLSQLQKIMGHVQPTSAHFLSRIGIDGIGYTVPSAHLGNSLTLIKTHNGALRPGCIQNIFQHSNQTFITAKFYHPLCQNTSHNPFVSHSILQFGIWSDTLGPVEVARAKSIQCHFMQCHTEWNNEKCVFVVSLNRTILV